MSGKSDRNLWADGPRVGRHCRSGLVDEAALPVNDDPWEAQYQAESTRDRRVVPRILQDHTDKEARFLSHE